jgi:hypothetical protein
MKLHPDSANSVEPHAPVINAAALLNTVVEAAALPNAVVDAAGAALPDTLETDDEVAHELARLSLPEPKLRRNMNTRGSRLVDGPLVC